MLRSPTRGTSPSKGRGIFPPAQRAGSGLVTAMQSTTTGRSTILIGDVHGHLDKLTSLWGELKLELGTERFETSTVIFLGDLCDRGPETSGVFNFLSSLKDKHPRQDVRHLAGNHDFAFATFLGLIPITGGAVEEGEFKPRRAEYPLWEDTSSKQAHLGMHLQGRRWGAFSREGFNDGINAFDSHATFTSYSAAPGDREDLLKKVPVEHKKILESLEFVVEVEDAEEHGKKLVAVHAGLETDCPFDVQMTALRQRRVDQAWVEALQGRANVINLPDDTPEDVIIASGHHGILEMRDRRIIIDECGGHRENRLAAVILPERKVVRSSS